MTPAPDTALRGELWIDAQLPPALAEWLAEWGAPCRHVAELGLLTAPDDGIFAAARHRRPRWW